MHHSLTTGSTTVSTLALDRGRLNRSSNGTACARATRAGSTSAAPAR